MTNFECHVTVHTDHAAIATHIAKELHWKTSEIARDPVLGDRNFFYLTTHSDNAPEIFARMTRCASRLRDKGVPVLREKVELIIHDIRHEIKAPAPVTKEAA